MKALRVIIGLLRVALHLFKGLAIVALIFPRAGAAGRERRIRRYCSQLLAICGVRLEIVAPPGFVPASHALIVSNHVSWLDIFVINSLQPCRFVAKADIRDWPLMGWLSARTGTIFISRGSNRDVRRIFKELVASVHAGERVGFFPEGTTAPQGTVLPFHANLFEAAIDAGVPLQPYAVRYLGRDGRPAPQADFVGETTFVQSLVAILGERRFTAQLVLLPTIATDGRHRRELAVQSRETIVAALDRLDEI
jgi:1-acyl-sn-glycerol-3-phosphate acyltransferase